MVLQIRIHPALPYGIMGFICLQSAVLALLLSETNGQSTLETLDDMINQGKDSPLLPVEQEGPVVNNKVFTRKLDCKDQF